MSADIVTLPLSRVVRPVPVLRRYDLAAMALLMGWHDVTARTVVQRLRQLARHDALPLPCTQRLRGGRRCHDASAIVADSQWDAQAVDAWHHGGPSPGAPAALPPLPLGTREAMARRAAQLLQAGGR